MKILLDSSALIERSRNNPQVIKLIEESTNVSISTLSVYEVLVGISSQKRKVATEFFKSFPLLPFTSRDSLRALQVYDGLANVGHIINTIDILLASQALERGLTIITKDADFARVKGLDTVLLK